MHASILLRSCALAALVAIACASGTPADPPVTEPPVDTAAIRLTLVASGLASPVHLSAPSGDNRIFVVEQAGRVRLIKGGELVATPFLDIRPKVRSGGEQGLLSIAFHPAYATNGLFFVNYTDLAGDTKVERYRVSSNADVADPASAKLILTVDQPFSNHNGGLVVFGPDGMLYIGMGDGGSGGDPQGHGQNTNTLLGALLRINVNSGDPYSVPTDNPFVGQSGRRGEIWASGLRNPWRYAFDRTAGMLYVADVGQNQWEEVNVVPASQKGVNYGWNIMEGRHCFNSTTCNQSGLTLPVLEYDHGDGCSVTGGIVYRGSQIPALQGHYFYADYCRGWVRSFKFANGAATDRRTWNFGEIGFIPSFGEDGVGELYVLSAAGRVYKLTR